MTPAIFKRGFTSVHDSLLTLWCINCFSTPFDIAMATAFWHADRSNLVFFWQNFPFLLFFFLLSSIAKLVLFTVFVGLDKCSINFRYFLIVCVHSEIQDGGSKTEDLEDVIWRHRKEKYLILKGKSRAMSKNAKQLQFCPLVLGKPEWLQSWRTPLVKKVKIVLK